MWPAQEMCHSLGGEEQRRTIKTGCIVCCIKKKYQKVINTKPPKHKPKSISYCMHPCMDLVLTLGSGLGLGVGFRFSHETKNNYIPRH